MKISKMSVSLAALILLIICTFFLTAAFVCSGVSSDEEIKNCPDGILVNLMSVPMGVDRNDIKFSWVVNDSEKDEYQTAYQINIAKTLEDIENETNLVYDSGKVLSSESTNVKCEGLSLEEDKAYYFKVRTWDRYDKAGEFSDPPVRFATAADNFSADAIWANEEANAVFARKEFEIPEDKEIESAIVKATALLAGYDSKTDSEGKLLNTRTFAYKLYLNGEFVGAGPHPAVYDGRLIYNTFDITDKIKNGENAVGAVCYANYGKQFIAEIKITYTDGSQSIIKTDDSWKTLDGTKAFGESGESVGTGYYMQMRENINALEYPCGWKNVSFDDSKWQSPEIKAVSENLYPDICGALKERIVKPSVVEYRKDRYFIDMGKEIIGGISFKLDNAGEPSKIEVRYGEELQGDGTVKNEMRTGNNYTEYFTLKQGSQEFENFGIKGFRYIEILNSPVEITAENITGIAYEQEFDEEASYFVSDNEILNEIYELTKYSIMATSQDFLTDSQTRERGAYEGDLYVNQLSLYSFSRNYNLVRYTNAFLAHNPTWPEEYHQITIMSAWEDYMATGDKACLESLYPYLENKLLDYDKYFDEEKNLYNCEDISKNILVDWPSSQRDGFVYENNKYNIIANSFAYAGLKSLSDICGVLDKREERENYNKKAERLKQGINSLYNPEKEMFSDGMSGNGELIDHYSAHSSFYPISLGAVDDKEKIDKALNKLSDKGISCSIYAAQFLISGLYDNGFSNEALKMLTNKSDFGWYSVIHNLNATIVPECWSSEYKNNMTFSHAWGSAPANIIVRNLCGIKPLEAGYEKILIKPCLGDELNKISVKAPTVKGSVCLTVNKEKNEMYVKIPANTTARVYIPFEINNNTVKIDDKNVPVEFEDGLCYIDNVGSGGHIFKL